MVVNYVKSFVFIVELIYIKYENYVCMFFIKVRICSYYELIKINYIKYVLLVL